MNKVACLRRMNGWMSLASAASVCALGPAALGQVDVAPSRIVSPGGPRAPGGGFVPRGGLCAAFDPFLDCQATSLQIAYNISTFATADAITAREPVSSICVKGFYFSNTPVQDNWVVTIYDDGGGVPGKVRETFTQGVDLVVNGPALTAGKFITFDVYEWNLELERPVDHAGACLWYELRNHAGDLVFQLDGNDFDFAFNGNLHAAQDFDQDGVYELDGEILPDDLNICINAGFVNNRLCFNDPCAGIEPRNDSCAGAIPLNIGPPVFGSTSCATADAGLASCSGAIMNAGVWYSVTGTGNTMTVDLCREPEFFNALEVFCGGCDQPVCIAGDDGSCASVEFCTAAGTEYLVFVHGSGHARGDFRITLSDSGAACSTPPSCTPCLGVTCPADAVPEAEGCEGGANDGCAAGAVRRFEPIVGDRTVCGTIRAESGVRDTDWFSVTAPDSGVIAATITPEFNGFAGILDLGTPIDKTCGTFGVRDSASFVACGPRKMVASGLTPGNTYVISVAPNFGVEIPCSRYFLEVDQGVPPPAVCCDFDASGVINSQDVFDFLGAFFANERSADFNADGAVNSQDFFDFVGCFFEPPSGCP